MLIRKEHIDTGGVFGIWKMEETKDELLRLFPEGLQHKAAGKISGIRSERRVIEWLSTRIMLFILLGEEKIIRKRKNGQPYITDHSYRISISHTKDYAAILLHKTQIPGIDIEIRSDRVKNIAGKFISDTEYIDPSQRTVHQLLHWSAKESLFKLMDEEGVDFKEHLHIQPFTPKACGVISATITKGDRTQAVTVRYEVHPEYVLTWAISPVLP